MVHTILALVLSLTRMAFALPDAGPAAQAQGDCGRFFVTNHFERLRYLDLLSRPRALGAVNADLRLATVMNSLLSDRPVAVARIEDGGEAQVVSSVDYHIPEITTDEDPSLFEMIWSHAGEVTRRFAWPARDPTLGAIGLKVTRNERGYLAEFGAETYPLHRAHLVGPHLKGGTRYVVSWQFAVNGDLEEVRLRAIEPRADEDPLVRTTVLLYRPLRAPGHADAIVESKP